jgi:ABC-type polysaccharide/polyol phosphate export permease
VLGRSYPPVNVRAAAWYLASVALMAVPVFFLLSSTVSETPAGALAAAPEVAKLIAQSGGLIVVAGLLYAGFRFMYPIVVVLVVVFLVRALIGPEPNLLGMLVPLPALLLLVTPTSLSWFLGVKKRALALGAEREFHLPQR